MYTQAGIANYSYIIIILIRLSNVERRETNIFWSPLPTNQANRSNWHGWWEQTDTARVRKITPSPRLIMKPQKHTIRKRKKLQNWCTCIYV